MIKILQWDENVDINGLVLNGSESFSGPFCLIAPTHPTPGIEPGDRMRCSICSMRSVSATLDTPSIERT